jgi:TPR repeat protein
MMHWPGLRGGTVALAGLLALLLAMPRSFAETSSWIGRAEKLEPSAPKAKDHKPAAPIKIIKTVPGPPKGMPAPTTRSASQSTYAKPAQPPAPGENAAYEAFDLGHYLTALDLAKKAAEKGDPQAHTLIGRIYAEGLAVPKNETVAAQWYARGAELGDPEAMFAVGVLLAEGRGVQKDRAEAARMFEAAALHRHPLANYNLALLFLKGDGKPQNPYRAFQHMTFAAEAGVAAAQYDLGTMYATGTGTHAIAFEAAKWIGKAAAAGLPAAQLDYGVLLFQGRGVEVDEKRGARMFLEAAEHNIAAAQKRLARCYAAGAGVKADPIEAGKWYFIAKAAGEKDEELEKFVGKLSRADRAKAQKAADDWRDRAMIGIE